MNTPHNIQHAVMQRIREGGIAMRPRWQFVLLGLLWGFGALLALLVVLYLGSLVVFVMRANGLWFAPFLGPRGWFDIFRSAPFYIILLTALCAVVLGALVRHFAFAYRRPVVLSLGAVLFVTCAGGILVGFTPFHREIHRGAQRGFLPGVVGAFYEQGVRPPLPDDMYRGTVVSDDGEFLVLRASDGATTSVHVTRHTRLPFGADFAPGDTLIIIGDEASGTLEAYGIMESDPDVDVPPPPPNTGEINSPFRQY